MALSLSEEEATKDVSINRHYYNKVTHCYVQEIDSQKQSTQLSIYQFGEFGSTGRNHYKVITIFISPGWLIMNLGIWEGLCFESLSLQGEEFDKEHEGSTYLQP